MWREMIQQNIQTDLARRAQNPAIENFGTIVRTAMEMGMKSKMAGEASALEEGRMGRTAAREATFRAYPPLAAQEAGLEVTPEMEAARLEGETGGPTWNQEQEIKSVKDGILRGSYSISKGMFGEMEVKSIKTIPDALGIIQYKGLDPSLFIEELKTLRARATDDDLRKMRPPTVKDKDWKKAAREQKIDLLEHFGIL